MIKNVKWLAGKVANPEGNYPVKFCIFLVFGVRMLYLCCAEDTPARDSKSEKSVFCFAFRSHIRIYAGGKWW